MKMFIKSTAVLLLLVFGIALATFAYAPLNSLTIGKDNMKGIELAIDCNKGEALQSLEKGMSSNIKEYRGMSYLLTAAIYKESGETNKVDETVQLFKNDSLIKDKDEAKFLEDMNCFETYFKEKRLDKNGSSTCQ